MYTKWKWIHYIIDLFTIFVGCCNWLTTLWCGVHYSNYHHRHLSHSFSQIVQNALIYWPFIFNSANGRIQTVKIKRYEKREVNWRMCMHICTSLLWVFHCTDKVTLTRSTQTHTHKSTSAQHHHHNHWIANLIRWLEHRMKIEFSSFSIAHTIFVAVLYNNSLHVISLRRCHYDL